MKLLEVIPFVIFLKTTLPFPTMKVFRKPIAGLAKKMFPALITNFEEEFEISLTC